MEVCAVGKLIRVQAKRENRRELARWARGIRGVRMVSSVELGFPPAVFPDIPERLLVDSMIDGLPYHLARHVPLSRAPRPRSRTVRAPAPAPTKPKGTPNAAPTRDRVEDARGDAVAPPAVADKARVATAGGPAIPDPSAEVIPAEETTSTATGPAEVSTTDPLARPREGTHYAGDGCQPPHPDPGPRPVEPTTTMPGEVVMVEAEVGQPLPEMPAAAYPPGTFPLEEAPADGVSSGEDPAQVPEPAAAAPPHTGTAEAAPLTGDGGPGGAAAGKPSLGSLRCDVDGCGRAFTTEHARRVHVGKAHPRSRGGGAG